MPWKCCKMVLSRTLLFPMFLEAIVSEKRIGISGSRASIQRAKAWRAGWIDPPSRSQQGRA